MKVNKHIIVSLIASLPACSGNPLINDNNNTITVNSDPSGALVYVMGEMVGATPASVNLGVVYPVAFSQESQDVYGRIVLKHDGCTDQIITVNSHIISKGLHAKLDCGQDVESHVISPVSAGNSVSQRLKQLQSLKDEGLINDEEYQAVRNRILLSL